MSSSAERCARKIAQHETPLVVGHFTSDGDSAASIGFERGQQTHSTVCIENLRDTRHQSESHRKLVKNVDKNSAT
jgi:single-stranded DNA-specific DHH superfamily exonuclease